MRTHAARRCAITVVAILACAGAARAYPVWPAVSLEKLTEEADIVFKGTVQASRIVEDEWFEPRRGFYERETQFRIVSVMKGEWPEETLAFRHCDNDPETQAWQFEPQYYHFELGRTYIVFVKRGADGVFQQLWANHKSVRDQGVFLCAGDAPVEDLAVENVVWDELTAMLASAETSDVAYAVTKLDQMSGGRASPVIGKRSTCMRICLAWMVAASLSCVPAALDTEPGEPAASGGGGGGSEGDLARFDPVEFWREQDDVPFDERVLETGEDGDVTWQAFVYTSELYAGAPMRIFAYYARPRASGPHPAVVSIHGGGGGADRNRAVAFAKAGYACVSYDWHVYGDSPAPGWQPGTPLPSESRTVYCNLRYDDWARHFVEMGDDGKLSVLYRGAMAARRALTWLELRDEVDAKRLAVEGHSWGGYLTQLVSGIDGRVRASVSSAAAGAWASRYTAGLEGHTKTLTPAEMREWSRRYDPASYASRISGPILIRLATGDFFGSVDTLAEYWTDIPGPKALELQPSANHGFSDVPTRVAWFDRWLAGGRAFPRVESFDVEEQTDGTIAVRARASGPDPIERCAVSWTTSPEPWNRRFWAQRLLELRDGEWTGSFAPNLAGGPLRVFASVADGRGLCASCMPVVRDAPSRGRDVRGEAPAAEAEIVVARARDGAIDWGVVGGTRMFAPAPEAVGEQSFRLGAAYDDAALWLCMDVDDASPWSWSNGQPNFWDGDSIQVRMRTDARCLEPGGPPADERVIHLGLYPDERTGAVRVHASRGRDFSVAVTDVSAVSASVDVRAGGGYVVVARLPWRFLDDTFDPEAGRRLRMGVMVNFGDAVRAERIGVAECNGANQFGNPDAWGTARLGGD